MPPALFKLFSANGDCLDFLIDSNFFYCFERSLERFAEIFYEGEWIYFCIGVAILSYSGYGSKRFSEF